MEKEARLAVDGGRRGRVLEDGSDDSTTLADLRRSADEDPAMVRLAKGTPIAERGRGEVVVADEG